MKKEQILLVVAVGVAGLVVWSNSGLYQSVGASSVPIGVDMETQASTPIDLRKGLGSDVGAGRNLLRQKRVERRKDPPKLDLPPSIGLPWVRPLPWPGFPAQYWGLLREPMTTVAKPGAKEADPADSGTTQPDDVTPEEQAALDAAREKAKEVALAAERRAAAARIVAKDGKEIPCRLTPIGAFQGQPAWVILEKWPTVPFFVEELNEDGNSVRGRYEVQDPDRYLTVHLEKTLENEYNEERIRRGVKDSDRTSNVEFGQWIRQSLAPRYGVPATRLALKHLGVAKALVIDVGIITLIGETCQDAYDIDEEIQAYLDYLQGTRAGETPVIVRLGDAYERGGALQTARETFEKAAKLGDNEGHLRFAALLLRLARSPADVDAAYAEFEKAQGAGLPAQRARALAGMARIALARGNAIDALKLAKQARDTDLSSFHAANALGVVLYAAGQFAEADQAFAAASAAETASSRDTHAKSNRAMALLAQDKLTEAVNEAQSCLDADPLNYFDPLVVLGEAQQRWGELTKSNDTFQTALQRDPRNAWILLRLAAVRLRDGLPKPALELVQGGEGVTGLLQIAPESVDALHVAGLACASQEQPDWPTAVKYIRRALDKEPKNLDLVYDLAKVLHLAGRTDEAIALLERETNPNIGAAKNDARVLALLAFVYFDGGRPVDEVFATLDRARRSLQAGWTKDYLDRVYQKVLDWNSSRIWEDDFKRAAGARVGNGWEEREALGVLINMDGERAVFRNRATPAQTRSQMTGLIRTEELQPMQAVEMTLKADPGFEFVVHLYQGELPDREQSSGPGQPPKRRGAAVELGFGRERDGRMLLYVYGGGESKQFMVPVKDEKGADRQWPEGFHRVGFRRTGLPQEGEWEISLDDEKITKVKVASLSAQFGKSAFFGVHVDADQGTQVDLQVDSVQIEKILGKR